MTGAVKRKLPIPVIDGMFRVPARLLVGRADLPKLRNELTAKYRDMEGNITYVKLYSEANGVFAMPRAFGRKRFPDLWRRALNRTVRRTFKQRLPIRIKPRDAAQQDFVNAILAAISGDVTEVQANAATGSGKTASACIVQAMRHERLLVIVHTNRIKEGWLGSEELTKGLRFFYGDKWVDENVGICQQDVCDYQGKKIVIAMAPSLCSRRYPEEFYKQFSMVAIDELHKFATPVLNQVIGMFPAATRIGLTATPKEGDMKQVIEAHFGPPAVVSKQEVLKPRVCRIKLTQRFDFTDDNDDPIDNRNSIITFMSRNKMRQDILTQLIYYRGYVRGKQCLVISDRTDQLLDFRKRLLEMDVPEDDIGVYAGSYRTGKTKLTGYLEFIDQKTGDTVKKHFRGLSGFATRGKAKAYVEKAIGSFARDCGVRKESIVDCARYAAETHKPQSEDYDRIERDCPIVLATYGIFDVAIDIKRLDWGLEASPRGDVAQPVGRILRLMDGKAQPEWYTIYDDLWTVISREILGELVTKNYVHKTPKRLEKQRMQSYAKQNATIVHVDDIYEALEKAKALYQKAA